MAPTRRRFLGTATAVTTLALAGCTTGDGGGQATTTGETTETTQGTMDGTTTSGTTTGGSATVQVYSHESLGDILVGPDELTLYMFEADTRGAGESTCYDSCAGAWPPLTASSPTAGDGVTATLSTFERDGGGTHVAANGWPLYYFASDQQPGDAKGQGVDGFGGLWWVLRPDGTVVRNQGTTTSGGETTTSGGGSGGTTTTSGGGPDY